MRPHERILIVEALFVVGVAHAFSKSWCGNLVPPPQPGMYGDLDGASLLNVSITPPIAQDLFQQALAQEWNFNKHESLRNFKRVVELAPNCAVCWWGLARGLGSNTNSYITDPAAFRAAANNATYMLAPSDGTKVRTLVTTIQLLKSNETASDVVKVPWGYPLPADLFRRRSAYAAAVCNSSLMHSDMDIAALCADALMAAFPWNYYVQPFMDLGPSALRPELLPAETILARLNLPGAVPHALAKHLYIHLMEPRTGPFSNALLGSHAGETLQDMIPSAGHLQHMPAHIYLRTGNWGGGIAASDRAAADNRAYISRCLQPYAFGHNLRMGGWHARLAGASAKAFNFSYQHRECSAWLGHSGLPMDWGRDGCSSVSSEPALALTLFGRWSDVLALGPIAPCHAETDCPNDEFHRGPRLYAQGMAREAQGVSSGLEIDALEKLFPPLKSGVRPQPTLVAAYLELKARRSYAQGDYVESIRLLRNLTEYLEHEVYIEPPQWYYDPSNCLGYVLLHHGLRGKPDPGAALEVYQAALRRFPGSGWALLGAAQSEAALGNSECAEAFSARFKKAWTLADVEISSSCLQFAIAEKDAVHV